MSKVYDLAFFSVEFQEPSFDPGARVVEISLEGLAGRRGIGFESFSVLNHPHREWFCYWR